MTAINKSPNVFSSTIQHIWHPSVDGSLISRNPYESVRNGQIAKVCPQFYIFVSFRATTVENMRLKAFSDRFRWYLAFAMTRERM
jgi:hypothetical protein